MGEQSTGAGGARESTACPTCGYELSTRDGRVLAVCPECGAPSPDESQHAARRAIIRWALLLMLWGIPLWTVGAALHGQRLMSTTGQFDRADQGRWTGSASINTAGFAAARLVGAALVLVGVGCLLAMRPRGLATTKIAWAGASLCGITAALAFCATRGTPPWWNAGGTARFIPSWVETWGTNAAIAASVWLIGWSIGNAAEALGHGPLGARLRRMAPWLAAGVLLMAVWTATSDELRTAWVSTFNQTQPRTPRLARNQMLQMQPPGPEPWYLAFSRWVEFVFPALKAGVVGALWFPAFLVRSRRA